MSHELRLIQANDDPAMAVIIREAMTEFGLNRAGTGFDDSELDRLSAAYSGGGAAFFVAVRDGVLLGGGGFAPLAGVDHTCEIQRMYLSPAARGLGLGRALLTQCLETAKAAGFRRAYLETMDVMTAAQGLYRAFGFEQRCGKLGDSGHCGCNTYFVRDLVSGNGTVSEKKSKSIEDFE